MALKTILGNADMGKKIKARRNELGLTIEETTISFAAGSDMLLDHIEEDLDELVSMPKGTHVGQLPASWLADVLLQQFYVDKET